MKAAILDGVENINIKDIPIPEICAGNVIVKVAYGGLCGPTDDAILKGLHPRVKFPIVLCHEFSGEIVEVGQGNKYFKAGDKVVVNPLISCDNCEICKEGNQYICNNLKLIGIDVDGGFQEYCRVPCNNLVKLPDDLPLDIAALTEPMAVGIHAIVESGLRIGSRVLIYGAGPIGLFTAEAARYAGIRDIILIDINEKRLKLAQSLGFCAVNDSNSDIVKHKEFDAIFETTGSEKVLKAAVTNVKTKGTLMIVGKFDYDVPFDLHTVLFKEITIKGARVYRKKEFLEAVNILTGNYRYFKSFISNYYGIDKINEVFSCFRERTNISRIMVSFK